MSGKISALPSGDSAAVLQAANLAKNAVLLARREKAANHYLQTLQEKETKERTKADRALQSAVDETRRFADEESNEKQKKLVQQQRYREDLEAQMKLRKDLESVSVQEDQRMRQEVELGVKYGEYTERKLREQERINRQRATDILKAQLDVQHQIRRTNDVTPKLV
jgi:tRNA U34 5-carboxymethylaminomethyl modifying enzyme MnmG/GidA